jgi:vacuolar-type H+-ATPase subunit E/Vma4
MAKAQQDDRLDRIEEKIDKLSEAIVAIARAEEKLSSLEHSNQLLLERFMKNEDRLVAVEQKTHEVSNSVSGIVKLFWAAVTTAVTAAVSAYVVSSK